MGIAVPFVLQRLQQAAAIASPICVVVPFTSSVLASAF
jgi:hypothetical protein